MGYSVDWLTVSQQRDDVEDYLAEWVVYIDPTTGELVRQSGRGVWLEGSYDTRVLIRALAGRVEWSGNPSRLGRPDNVWGLCFEDAWEIVQRSLEDCGLPRFDVGPTDEVQSPTADDREKAQRTHHGAVVSRVDLATCWTLGGPDEVAEALRRWSSARMQGRQPKAWETTLAWRSKAGHSLSVYDKGEELRAHRSDADDVDYRAALADDCETRGIVRVEHRFGIRYLNDSGFRSVWSWLYAPWDSILGACERREQQLREMVEGEMQDDIQQVMVADGISEAVADRAVGILHRWQQGYDVRRHTEVSKGTWSKYRNLIRRYAGVDVHAPATSVAPMRRNRRIQPQVAHPPAWHWTQTAA